MFWRKWLVRFLVFSFVGGLAAAGWIYQRWTNPAAVRKITLTKLGDIFVGADLNLDSAHMRLLGGIALSDLRMARKDDLDKNEFASVHSAVIYLDKEQLLGGKVPIRKVELTRPRLRILRTADGHWNLAGIIGPPNLAVPWPTVVVRHGTISLEDRQAAPSSLPMEIREVALTLLNDPHVPSGPISVVRFEGTGVVDVAGPVEIKGSYDRVNDDFTLTLTANSIPVGPALVQRLANYYTELGIHARQLEGQGLLRVDLAYHPKAPRPWTHEIRFELAQGKLTHARLPVALEQLRGTIVCVNGQLPLVQFQAVSGSTKFDLIVHDLTPNENRSLESLVHDCELKIDNVELCPAFLAALS